jgi:hypothetical protein
MRGGAIGAAPHAVCTRRSPSSNAPVPIATIVWASHGGVRSFLLTIWRSRASLPTNGRVHVTAVRAKYGEARFRK